MSQCNQQYSLSIESQQTVFAPMGIWTWVVRFWRLTHQLTRPLTNFNVYIIVLRDFNPEENVSDKFKKINEIKDGRGLRKFIKEALNASAGKTSYDLLGSVEIPLKVRPILNRGWLRPASMTLQGGFTNNLHCLQLYILTSIWVLHTPNAG